MSHPYSGVGGQIDFIRGAALCEDGLGKPIFAMKSTTDEGISKIVPTLHSGINARARKYGPEARAKIVPSLALIASAL